MRTFLILLFALRAGAAAWYVDRSATGANNGTSAANAWTAMSNIVWSSVNSGDSIRIGGGTYGEHFDLVNEPGISVSIDPAATNAATFIGSQLYNCDGCTVDGRLGTQYGIKIDGTSSYGQHAVFIRESSNLVVRGIEVTRQSVYASDVAAHHLISLGTGANYGIQILDSYLHHSSADGVNANFTVSGGTGYSATVLSNVVISHVGDDGVQIANRQATIANCRITSDIPAMFGGHPDGVQLNPDGGNLKIVGNYFSGFNQNIFVEYGSSNILIWNNILVGDPTHTSGTDRAMSISARTNTWTGDYVVANNTMYGFVTASAINDATTLLGLSGLVFGNNVCVDSRWFMASASQSLLDASNLYWHTGAQFYDSGGSPVSAPADPFDGSSVVDDPEFVGEGDFRISATSPARGIGSDLSARFTDDYGRATRSVPWDAGAWEYVGRTATARTASVGTATEN